MQAYLECIPCILRQVAEVAGLTTADAALQREAMRASCRLLSQADPLQTTAPELTQQVHRKLKTILGQDDLYKEIKEKENSQALALLPQVEPLVQDADDPLEMAVRVSILGNVIDYGAMLRFDIHDVLARIHELPFGIYDYERFKKDVIGNDKGPKILYIGDNAGEIMFDAILVKELLRHECEITFAVKSEPILNDITLADAQLAGLPELVSVIESGSTTPGTLLSEATDVFLQAYKQADFIIAKGQGNLETLDELDKPVYFLLKMKCPYIARDLKVEAGDLVLWKKE